MRKFRFLVITGAGGEDCLYNPALTRKDGKYYVDCGPKDAEVIGNCFMRVFNRGELLICDESGYETAGNLRRPDKWHGVKYKEFDSLEAAVEFADHLLEEDFNAQLGGP